MGDTVSFTPEQFNELLKAFSKKDSQAAGLGKDMRVPGLGCGDGGMGSLACGVYEMLALGSPRLALAKALGVRLVPYVFNIRATFDDIGVSDIPNVGADVKIVQDTLVESMLVRLFNKSTTANQNLFQAQSDWYYTFQSGIEATLDIVGAPRPSIAPQFTPLASLADAFNGDARWPRGMVLSYQQQLEAAFHASITLPFVPIEVVLTFRAFAPDNEIFTDMTNKEAFAGLATCGFQVDESYCTRVLSVCR
jgi:hypothetical protein